jgi:hypothetical protein
LFHANSIVAILNLLIATDPARYRLMIIPSIIEKFSLATAAAVLLAQWRVPTLVCGFAAIDFLLGVLFVITFVRLGRITGS